jgi:hypothetical protein
LAVTLYFVIPRNPSFEFYPDRPFDVDNSTISFSRTPTNFSFTGNLNLYGTLLTTCNRDPADSIADSSSSYVPVQFSNLQAKLYDLNTNKVIATGDLGKHKVNRGANQPIILPVTFSYSALNTSDQTWLDMYSACGHLWPGTARPGMSTEKQNGVDNDNELTNRPEIQASIAVVYCGLDQQAGSVDPDQRYRLSVRAGRE